MTPRSGPLGCTINGCGKLRLALQDQLAAEDAGEDVLFEAVEEGEDASDICLRSLLVSNVVVGDDQVLTRPKLRRGALKTLRVTH